MNLKAGLFLLFLVPGTALGAGALDYYAYGNTLLSQGKAAEAASYYQYAAQLDPKLWQAWQALGTAQERTGAMSQALASYAKALELQPENPSLSAHVAAMKARNLVSVPSNNSAAAGLPILGLAPVQDGPSEIPGLGKNFQDSLVREIRALERNEVRIQEGAIGVSRALKVVIQRADLRRGPALGSAMGGLAPTATINGTVIVSLELSGQSTPLIAKGEAYTRVLAEAPSLKNHDDLVLDAAAAAAKNAAKALEKIFKQEAKQSR